MLRTKLRTLIRDTTGFDVHKYEPGQTAVTDIKRLIGRDKPVLFDVGANIGQTIDDLLAAFPRSEVHAFEPGEKAFGILSERHSQTAILNHCGVGSAEQDHRLFFESAGTVMSSFLPIGAEGWGAEGIQQSVAVTTVDAYCSRKGIDHIDLLKTDVQGYDLEVLKGANRMLSERRVSLIYIEINFAEMYEGQARADEILRFIFDHGLRLVAFYKMHMLNGKAGWVEALFA